MLAATEERLVSGEVWDVLGFAAELDAERCGDGLRDLILNREHIGHLTVVALRPEVAAIGGCDQLGRDAYAVAGAADATLENRRDAQHFGDFADIFVHS